MKKYWSIFHLQHEGFPIQTNINGKTTKFKTKESAMVFLKSSNLKGDFFLLPVYKKK